MTEIYYQIQGFVIISNSLIFNSRLLSRYRIHKTWYQELFKINKIYQHQSTTSENDKHENLYFTERVTNYKIHNQKSYRILHDNYLGTVGYYRTAVGYYRVIAQKILKSKSSHRDLFKTPKIIKIDPITVENDKNEKRINFF